MKIDAKELIQKAWVLEVGLLILYGLVVLPWMSPERIELFISLLPIYASLIAAQGIIAGAGPRIKTLQENQKLKIESEIGP